MHNLSAVVRIYRSGRFASVSSLVLAEASILPTQQQESGAFWNALLAPDWRMGAAAWRAYYNLLCFHEQHQQIMSSILRNTAGRVIKTSQLFGQSGINIRRCVGRRRNFSSKAPQQQQSNIGVRVLQGAVAGTLVGLVGGYAVAKAQASDEAPFVPGQDDPHVTRMSEKDLQILRIEQGSGLGLVAGIIFPIAQRSKTFGGLCIVAGAGLAYCAHLRNEVARDPNEAYEFASLPAHTDRNAVGDKIQDSRK